MYTCGNADWQAMHVMHRELVELKALEWWIIGRKMLCLTNLMPHASRTAFFREEWGMPS